MRRVKTTCLLAADGIYRREPCEVEAYVTHEKSRWAVTRAPGAKHWGLTHRGSGLGVGSILPIVSGGLSMTRILNVVRAWEAHTEIDFGAFDAMKELGDVWGLGGKRPPPSHATTDAMRDLAKQAA